MPAHHRVVLYACTTAGGDAAGILAELHKHAVEHGWEVAGAFADFTGATSESHRPQFLTAKSLIAEDRADGIVTRYPAMAAYLPTERAALARWLSDRGAQIHYTRTPTSPVAQP